MYGVFVVLVMVPCGIWAFLDLTDVEDQLALLWGNKNSLIQDKFIPCETTLQDGTVVSGVCTNRPHCLLSKGQSQSGSNCPGSFSTCCIYSRSCSKTTQSRETYLTNAADVLNYGECNYNIQLASENVCQIRLDFEKLVLEPATLNSLGTPAFTCQNDKFSVLSYESWIPSLCGYNSGQHMYITVQPNSKSVALHIALQDQSDRTIAPQWRIRVRQLECPSANRFVDKFRNYQAAKDYALVAPNYALQYYTARTGYIRSFGYNEATGAVYHYISDHKYAIAFKRSSSTCGIRFQFEDFVVPSDTSVTDCTDYLFIPPEVSGTTVNKICGTELLVVQSTPPGPLYVYFYAAETNALRSEDVNDGFKIKYELLSSCS